MARIRLHWTLPTCASAPATWNGRSDFRDGRVFFRAAGSMLVRSRLPLLTVVRSGKVGINKMKRKNTEELTTSHKAHRCDTRITLKYGHALV